MIQDGKKLATANKLRPLTYQTREITQQFQAILCTIQKVADHLGSCYFSWECEHLR